MRVSQLSSQHCWLQRDYLTQGHQSDGAKNPHFLVRTRKILFKKNQTVFKLQGLILLQQPQQSCDILHRLTTAPFRKISGECREIPCPATEGWIFLNWIFLPHFLPSTIPGLLCKAQRCDTFKGVPHQRRESKLTNCDAVCKGLPKDTAH